MALAVAYLLLVQSLAAAFGLGAAIAAPVLPLDPAICTTTPPVAPIKQSDPGHPPIAACCTLMCGLLASPLTPLPTGPFTAPPPETILGALNPVRTTGIHRKADRKARLPRAPPVRL
ncbi:hypothetical protein [Rhodoligotrophos ferricapiens]|uniref:hypothetical protein n=1 Tax=Rhodoligotrophos ferricapiens TaxID=3069264 RepID=UPI00315CF273